MTVHDKTRLIGHLPPYNVSVLPFFVMRVMAAHLEFA